MCKTTSINQELTLTQSHFSRQLTVTEGQGNTTQQNNGRRRDRIIISSLTEISGILSELEEYVDDNEDDCTNDTKKSSCVSQMAYLSGGTRQRKSGILMPSLRELEILSQKYNKKGSVSPERVDEKDEDNDKDDSKVVDYEELYVPFAERSIHSDIPHDDKDTSRRSSTGNLSSILSGLSNTLRRRRSLF